MENATKALIIAAAVLVAIIIISLTLGVVRQGQETISSADMSQAEMDAYNAKFTMYEGTNVSTANVNALLNTVLVHLQNEYLVNKTNRVVGLFIDGKNIVNPIGKIDGVIKITGSNRYTVKCTYTNGLVTRIDITTNP